MSTYAHNKRASFDFEILETIEAGLELLGTEVKAIRAGKANLAGGHVIVRGGEAYLVNVSIQPFQKANAPKDYEDERPRKLLLNKKEMAHLLEKSEQKGLTAIPMKLYNKGSKLKLEIGIVRGKKKYDKRETIKKRDTERDLQRSLK